MKHYTWMFSLLLAAAIPAMALSPPAGPGLYETQMLYDQSENRGVMSIYNNKGELVVNMKTSGDWLISELQLFVSHDIKDLPIKKERVDISKFPFKYEYEMFSAMETITLNLNEFQQFEWGQPWQLQRVKYVALHADLVKLDSDGEVIEKGDAWGYGDIAVEGSKWGTMLRYKLTHPKIGHFRDSPVGGAVMISPTFNGRTGNSGEFTYFPGESADFYIGNVHIGKAVLDERVTPLDFFGGSDTTDPRVVNMARLLQSLDADGDPKASITIKPEAEACLSLAVGSATLDFADTEQMNSIITSTIANCSAFGLVEVSAEDAVANLEEDINSYMFRKNVSKTPEMASTKAKLNVMPVWLPAFKADGEAAVIEYQDKDGILLRTATEAKPLVITYTDADPITGAHDTYGAISRDDGNTWKRANLSRSGSRSSFPLANGKDAYGDVKKPVFQVKGNKVLAAWSSKFCKGGKPGYAIDLEDDYTYDDPYYVEDIWGVGGPQRSHDYTEDGFPDVGELPYSCVWVARGIVATQGDVDKGVGTYAGDVVWFKPERLTSARRDALQLFMGGGGGAGFALAWQEDPAGLRPGKEAGPGHGWSGATTNHKTDIWYSYITWADFAKVDTNFVLSGDPEHDDLDFIGRPKALVPMSLPVRLSDNDVVNEKNLLNEVVAEDVDVGDGTHAYGNLIPGLCEGYYEFINNNDEPMKVCITDDHRLLDGDTGASRVNLFLQPYKKTVDGVEITSAWAIINYEETKGAGAGPPDETGIGESHSEDYIAEEGKNVIYHSFDFQNPDLVSAGHILNFPEMNEEGDLVYLTDEAGTLIPDWQGYNQLAYENARRARFILQGKSAVGPSKTVMLIVYKEGQEGMGRPSDIMLRRVVSKVPGNPYAFSNIICDGIETAANGKEVCVLGTQNMSTVTPTEVTAKADGDLEAYGYIKVVEWEQTLLNMKDSSSINPYEDARAHRGQIRGDLVTMGYSYTPNWAAARNGNDNYDFVVRRSFDGGQTWTTDPNGIPDSDGVTVTHCQVFTTPAATDGGEATKEEVCTSYGAGEFEQARNLSQLPNAKSSVIEPRIVCPPGTIKNADGTATGYPEDIQDKAVCYVAYGTSTNPKKDPITGLQESAVPQDLYYSFTQDKGESYYLKAWDVNPESDGTLAGEAVYRWDYLAKGEPEQGEVQLRMTPDGSRFYSSWLEEGEDGSDIVFRRIMPETFEANVPPAE